MKAYAVSGADDDKGTGVIFAENRNQAKTLAHLTNACDEDRYVDIRATRLPLLDNLYSGNPVGDWSDMKIRTVLVKEYGWYCLDPNKDECEKCGLCKEDD